MFNLGAKKADQISGQSDAAHHNDDLTQFEKIRAKILDTVPVLKNYNGALATSSKLGTICILQTLVILMLVQHVANRPITQVVTPPNFTEEISMKGGIASESYQTAWAMFVADQIGNINAQRAEFTKGVIRRMIPAAHWTEVDSLMTQQLHRLKLKKIEERFISNGVTYDPRSSLVWITGEKETTNVRTGQPSSELWTFEIKIIAENGSPQIVHLQQYPGKPTMRRRSNEIAEKGGNFENTLEAPSE